MTGKIQSLSVQAKTFLVTTARVDPNDVRIDLKERIKKKEFAKGPSINDVTL